MNVGKIFEKDFAESATKQGIFCHRLKDTDIAFNNNGITSYTPKNPCDYFLFAKNINFLYIVYKIHDFVYKMYKTYKNSKFLYKILQIL